jgi:hypothetical protein
MSTLRVAAGLNKTNKLPETQVVFIGRHKHLKALTYESVAEKLQGVNEVLFNEAVKQLDAEGGSVPIHLNLAKVCFFNIINIY